MKVTIVIPVLNESATIVEHLLRLQEFRQRGCDVVLVDGGSTDNTLKLARPHVDQALISEPGRARQMMSGAKYSNSDALLFLHADTRLPPQADSLIKDALETAFWGRFDVRLSGRHWMFPVIAWFMNKRSRLTGVATGDQAIFVRRSFFESEGGFRDIPLMEDIDLSKRLKAQYAPVCISTPLITSSRRWEENGILNTILLMWKLRILYFMGVSPEKLYRQYY